MIIIWGICLKILPKFNKMNIFKKTNWDLLKKLVKKKLVFLPQFYLQSYFSYVNVQLYQH